MPSRKLQPKPDTQSIPENRRGTRTHRGYILHMIGGNGVTGGRAAHIEASPRQWAKARQILEAASFNGRGVQGRIIRACVRAAGEALMEDLDASYYGHP